MFFLLTERFCGVENCLKCSEATTSRCDECQTGYVLSTDNGQCTGKSGGTVPTSTPGRDDGANNSQDSGSSSGLTDFEITGLVGNNYSSLLNEHAVHATNSKCI